MFTDEGTSSFCEIIVLENCVLFPKLTGVLIGHWNNEYLTVKFIKQICFVYVWSKSK